MKNGVLRRRSNLRENSAGEKNPSAWSRRRGGLNAERKKKVLRGSLARGESDQKGREMPPIGMAGKTL